MHKCVNPEVWRALGLIWRQLSREYRRFMATGTILLPIMGCVLDAASPPGYAFTNSRPKLLFDDSTDEIV